MKRVAKLGVALGGALLTLSGLAAVPASGAEVGIQAYSCNVTVEGERLDAGYYSGMTVQPSSTSVTAAGKEAQCLLKSRSFDPGTVDGIFGSNSQTAAKQFQAYVNQKCGGTVLTVDGKVGPKTWPYLRDPAVCWE